MGRHGIRAAWESVPLAIREQIADIAGQRIVEATNLVGGFSPGPAARCVLDDGRLVFVKAAGLDLNPITPGIHRREAAVLRGLPDDVPTPKLLGVVDDGDWVAIVTEWVDGRPPVLPIGPDEVGRVLGLAERLAEIRVPSSEYAPVLDVHSALDGNWTRLVDEPIDGLDNWSLDHLEQLAELEQDAAAATSGDRLAHLDLRTDNVVLSDSGPDHDVIVDWPGASIGAEWVDLVGLLPSLELDGGPRCADAFAASNVGRRADQDCVDAFLATIAGYFTRQSLLAPPPGLPTLRAFQAAQGAIARRWLSQRRGWSVSSIR